MLSALGVTKPVMSDPKAESNAGRGAGCASRSQTGAPAGQLRQHGLGGEAVEFDHLVPRGVAAQQLRRTARAVELLREKAQQCFVGFGVHRWRGHFDAQFRAQWFADFIGGSARLQFDGQRDTVSLNRHKYRKRRLARGIERRLHDRFSALNTARTEASSMLVSTPAPQRVRPSLCLI